MGNPIPNPSGCCGIPACCDGAFVPDVIVATFESISGCGCADGTTVELAGSKPNPDPASGTVWVGAGPFGTCGGDVSIALLCVADAHCAFKLDVDFTGCAASVDGKTPDSCECDANTPLNVVFDNIPVAGCCNAGPPEEVKITITE